MRMGSSPMREGTRAVVTTTVSSAAATLNNAEERIASAPRFNARPPDECRDTIQYKVRLRTGWTLRQPKHYASVMPHPRPFNYHQNFTTTLGWLQPRIEDLLNETEVGFIDRFQRLPLQSSALLVWMLGRRGDLFRSEKLRYEEIGCARAAATALTEAGWLD